MSPKAKEFTVVLVCLVLPAGLMALLPFVGLAWGLLGACMLWPVASFVTEEELPLFYWFWAVYYLATCAALWLVVWWVRRRIARRHAA